MVALQGAPARGAPLHSQRSVMGGSGELAARVAAPAGPAGAARRQQQRGAPPCTAAWPGWGRSEPPKELAKDPEAKFRQ